MSDKVTTQSVQEIIKNILASTGTKTGGLHAHKKGHGPADEVLWYAALAAALTELRHEGMSEEYLQQQLTTLLTLVSAMQPRRRRDTILYLSGLSENPVITTQGGISTQSYGNTRGKEICKGLLKMNTVNMQLALQIPVSDSDLASERLREINEWCRQFNEHLVADKHAMSLEEKRRQNGTNPFSSLWKTIFPSRKK